LATGQSCVLIQFKPRTLSATSHKSIILEHSVRSVCGL